MIPGPEPLTKRQRTIFLIVALLCAASRFLAMARSLWDWDEALFTLGMRDYDVTLHHPHPPGFPAYIALARLARLVVASDFRALQAVNLIAAMLVFPAIFLLARELWHAAACHPERSEGPGRAERDVRADMPHPSPGSLAHARDDRFTTSVIASVLFAFFPNVWFFGGGAFSDIPSIVLVCFAAALLLRGARDRNAYWLGTLLLAIAIGIRPQNLLVGLFPGIYATRKRRPHEIAIALLIGVVIVGASFGGAIAATGSFDEYLRVVREHGDYITRVDSFRSEARPALWRLLDRFFVKQYQSPLLSVIASLLVIVSAVGAIRQRDRSMLYALLTFAPFAIFAWLMLDRFSVSRFSIGYQPMFALFAADGIRRLAKQRAWLEAALASVLIAAFIAYTLPELKVVRTTVSPSILAAEAITAHVDPAKDVLYVGHTMSKFVDLVAPGLPYRRVIDDRALPLAPAARAWLLAEVTKTTPEGFIFRRERGHLWNIARRHYFEIVLEPLNDRPQFVSGWYDPETEDIHEWRWMSGRSVTLLPPQNGNSVLRLHLGIPGELMEQRPEVTVKINGKVVDRFRTAEGYLERNVRVTAAPNRQPNILELSIDRTVTGTDRRTLGLRLRYLAWGPV